VSLLGNDGTVARLMEFPVAHGTMPETTKLVLVLGLAPNPARRTAGQLAGGDDDYDEQSGEDKALRRHYIAWLLLDR